MTCRGQNLLSKEYLKFYYTTFACPNCLKERVVKSLNKRAKIPKCSDCNEEMNIRKI